MREYFIQTKRIGFSKWREADIELAMQLWGDSDVTHFICATGKFTPKEVMERFHKELQNDEDYDVQYWTIFDLASGDFIGCCGLRPYDMDKRVYEIGFHLCKAYWGKGYAYEAASAVISYAFDKLGASSLFAGHHPENIASQKLILKLGFRYIGKNFYDKTGLFHPSYEFNRADHQI